MTSKMGEKIRTLRRERDISQDTLAQSLGVTFQAVSKWENGLAMPDVMMVPAIASFFGISTDELFDYNVLENEKNVKAICDEAYRHRESDPAKSEAILREGLKKYPGNDTILNNILYTIPEGERLDEVIGICKSLIETTKDAGVKYDALRILADVYASQGEYQMAKTAIDQIPEIYFTHLELDARLLAGSEFEEEAAQSARNELYISAEKFIMMLECLIRWYARSNDNKNALKMLTELEKFLLLLGEITDPNGRYSNVDWLENFATMLDELHELTNE